MTDEELFAEALKRHVFVPWGVECEDCGLVAYAESIKSACLACKSIELMPLYVGRPKDVLAAQ